MISALTKEKNFCKQTDEEFTNSVLNLESVYCSINKKVHEIQYKYQWHNLNKNPKDLPPANTTVMVVDEYNNYNLGYIYDSQSTTWNGYRGLAIMQPVAWKYIEKYNNT